MGKIREGFWGLHNYHRLEGQYHYLACFQNPVAACGSRKLKAWVRNHNTGKYVPYNGSNPRHAKENRVECAMNAGQIIAGTYFTAFRVESPHRELELTLEDIRDMLKVVSTEVDERITDMVQRKKQAEAVIDTILNRAYLERGNLRAVVNKPGAFSAVNPKGIQVTPDSVLKEWTSNYTLHHLQERANGKPSIIGGHFNYLNPNESDESKKRQWGNDVYEQAKRTGLIFGTGELIHAHGTAKGEKQAPAFHVILPAGFPNLVREIRNRQW